MAKVKGPYQISTFYTLQILRYSLRQDIISRSHHNVANLYSLTNVTTKDQLPTPYDFQYIARTRFKKSRSLQHGQTLNEGHTMALHTYTLPTNVPPLFKLQKPYVFGDIALISFFPLPTRTQWGKTIPTQTSPPPPPVGQKSYMVKICYIFSFLTHQNIYKKLGL